jgi:predicted phosphodiesterase
MEKPPLFHARKSAAASASRKLSFDRIVLVFFAKPLEPRPRFQERHENATSTAKESIAMKTTRRQFAATSTVAVTGLLAHRALATEATLSAPALPVRPSQGALRVCFFTDAHLPGPHTHEHARGGTISDAALHYQERIRRAFDKANAFNPDAYVFGGDNVFAVDQGNDEENATAQFNNWKAVVKEKVSVPHHSVIGNHDIWRGDNPKAMAIDAFGMPHRYYAWKMGGWKFIMLDVFGGDGKLDAKSEQSDWLIQELEKPEDKEPVCVVTHAPLAGMTAQHVGGAVRGAGFNYRAFFYERPQVRLALSGHQHMVDFCRLDRVTYICGGAVSGGWWAGDYQHFGPVFLIFDLKPDGAFDHQEIYWERDNPGPYNEKSFPIEQHKDLYNS